MSKKLLLWLCAFLLLVTAAVSAGAELTRLNEGSGGVKTLIYFIPATGDATEMTTARYIAETVAARRGGQNVSFAKYNGKAFLESTKVFTKGNAKGQDTVNSRLIPKDPESADYDIWFLVPQEALDSFINNTELMDQCRGLLVNEQSRLHAVLISDRDIRIDPDSALGMLAAEGKTDWIVMHSDFLLPVLPGSADEVHTGSFLFPALFGAPADLRLSQSEDGMSWSFRMPQNGDAFILVRWEGKPGTVICADGNGIPVQEKETIRVTGLDPSFTGSLLEGLAADGEFTVSCQDGVPHAAAAFWYPNLAELSPVLDVGEEPWKRGSNELLLSLGNTWHRTDNFVVRFRYQEDDTQGAWQTASYDADRNAWVYAVDSIGPAVRKITVTPTAVFRMMDGNLIWKWQGEQKIIDVESEGVSEKSGAPEAVTLYYDGRDTGTQDHAAGSLQYDWNQFFRYNAGDQVLFDAQVDGGGDTSCVRIRKSDAGVTFTALTDSEKPDECTVVLTGKNDQGEAAHTLSFRRVNIADLIGSIAFTVEEETVPAGGKLNVSAVIPAETAARWKESRTQLPDLLPELPTLSLSGWTDSRDGSETAFFAWQSDDSLKADLTFNIPGDQGAGNVDLHLAVESDAGEVIREEETVSFAVRNDPPEITRPESIAQEVCLEGFPWAYQRQENLLATVFGTDRPFEFFRDPEDLLTSVNVKVIGADGRTIQEETIHNPEDQMIVPIAEPGTCEIRMAASDGVNLTEEISIPVKVYSRILRYVSFAVAGLAALLLLLLIILVIRHVRKPSFDHIAIRCYASSDEEPEYGTEIMSKCVPVSMANFGKKGVTLAQALILCRQPLLGKDNTVVARDILLFPTKHNELSILFGKDAMKIVGRHEKRELLSQGRMFRMRIGNVYVLIENVQAG